MVRQPHGDGDFHGRGDTAYHLTDLFRPDADVLQLGANGGKAAQLQRICPQALHTAGQVPQLGRSRSPDIADEEGIAFLQALYLLLHILQSHGAIQGGIVDFALTVKDARADDMALFQGNGFSNNSRRTGINGLLHGGGITAPGTGCRYNRIFERQAHKIDG